MNLPRAFREQMEHLLGKNAPLFFRALEEDPVRAFRFDPKKVSRRELEEAFGESLSGEVPYGENALLFRGEGIGNHPYHHGGALYVQEPGAMAPVFALGKEKVTSLLDVCASPGGKSLQGACLLVEDGFLVCNEPEGKRRKVLMQNLERMGEKRALVSGYDGRSLPSQWEGAFDLVICDVPCSGEGMMRKNPEAVSLWREENIPRLAALQKGILTEAAKCVAPGGRLLYSTCTYEIRENEEQVARLLEENPCFSLISPTEEVKLASTPAISVSGHDLSFARRFYPHSSIGEGQFFALFRKAGTKTAREEKKETKPREGEQEKQNRRLAQCFLGKVLRCPYPGELFIRGEEVYLVPPCPFSPSDFVSPGVLVGEIRKGRVVPHHRFFLAFADLFSLRVHLSPEDIRVKAYLRGEEIPAEGEGFGVLFCGNTSLGGIKISRGRGKNYYPKGLRKV